MKNDGGACGESGSGAAAGSGPALEAFKGQPTGCGVANATRSENRSWSGFGPGPQEQPAARASGGEEDRAVPSNFCPAAKPRARTPETVTYSAAWASFRSKGRVKTTRSWPP